MMNNTYTKNEMLELTDLLRREVMARMIDSLEIPPGGTGLDAGCGIGSQIPLLARAAGRGCRGGSGRGGDGYIVGVDYDIDSLLHARSRPTQKNASYLRGNLTRLPFSDDTFDWAVSVDCVGMMPESAESMISELVRIIKPGGMLALASWTSQQLLPGHPLLETRLNATAQGVAPFRDGLSPSLHFLRLGERLEAAGLGDILVRSFLGDIHPPRDTREERALSSLFFMRWGNDPSDLPEKERSLYRSLIDPASDRCIYRRSDYYGWFIYTLFTGWQCQADRVGRQDSGRLK